MDGGFVHLSGLSVGADVWQLDGLLLLSVGRLVGDLVGLDGSFVGMFVGLFTFIVGENVGHCSNLRGTILWPA